MTVRVYRNRVALVSLVVLALWVYAYYYYITSSPGGDFDDNVAKMDHIERLREHLSEGDLKEVVINSEETIKLAKPRKLVLRKGLDFDKGKFTLNGKPHVILSGAMHYFRVPEQYWRDRMLKMKACGLNTVET